MKIRQTANESGRRRWYDYVKTSRNLPQWKPLPWKKPKMWLGWVRQQQEGREKWKERGMEGRRVVVKE